MSRHYKPKPKVTDDICVKHNRRLRDYELVHGCVQCERERMEDSRKTVINVLKPEPPRKISYDEFNDNITSLNNGPCQL